MVDKSNSERLPDGKVDFFINRARSAFTRNGSYQTGQNLAQDFSELDLYTAEEQHEAIAKCLQEISPNCYSGPHPPNHIACEPVCKGERLLQFVWISDNFGVKMCFKLAINTRRQSDERLIVVRLHRAYDPNRFTKLDLGMRTGENK